MSCDTPSFDISVRHRIGERMIVLDFQSGPGVTLLHGPSGAGKSTILNMIAGLIRPDYGRIEVAGATLFDSDCGIDLPSPRRQVGYLFQDRRLFPHMRVRENLTYGLRRGRGGNALIGFDDAVAFLGITHLLHRWPYTLSGGEAQRVAIGRLLLSAPRFLLMDEPLSHLDAGRRAEMLVLIEQIRDEFARPILYVSHDSREGTQLAAQAVAMGGASAIWTDGILTAEG